MDSTDNRSRDMLAVALLIALWVLYFWRLFTPNTADALSLTEGDFSGQFVAFMAYQTERLSNGDIPLWNPYNYAGHPFLADTQSAVFYPPRLLTVALVSGNPTPGNLYAALQTEMALHVLLGTLFMYAFVRRLTSSGSASTIGGLVSALVFGYGGYLTGYAPLQLAILEAGIWLPLVLLGIFQATRTPRPGWMCMVLAGVVMGLSLLAGHPQTSLFMIYFALAFLAYRLWGHPRSFILAAVLFGLVAGGLAAIQLLPGLEYLQHTTRQTMSFDDKGNGFPYIDIAQVLFPGFITVWSPLYLGIAGLVLAVIAVWRGAPYSRFLGIAALFGLGLSFGAGTVLYDLAYLIAPGASWFRGQERTAFIVAQSASMLAGLGAVSLLSVDTRALRRLRYGLIGLVVFCVLLTGILFVAWRSPDGSTYESALRSVTFATFLAALSAAIIPSRRGLVVVALLVFDLFSVTTSIGNYEPVPADERLPEPIMIAQVRDEKLPPGARVDGLRGLRDNWGTLYNVADIRGISPLILQSIHTVLNDLPEYRAWDLLAVRYVLSDWNELPVPSEIVETAEDDFGPYNVHLLESPRDFAHLTYGISIVGSDDEAYGLLRVPAFDTRQIAILDSNPGVDLPGTAPDDPGEARITRFEPEQITIEGDTSSPAILTLALPHYPGWQVTVNGEEADLLRAYGGLSAVALPDAGSFTVELRYRPWTFSAGMWISLITLVLVIGVTATAWIMGRRRRVS